MNYSHFFEYMALGAAGAAALESIKLYEQYSKVPIQKFKSQLGSPIYWCILILFLISSGFAAWVINVDVIKPKVLQVVSAGAAARTLFRELMSAKISSAGPILGEHSFTWRDMFI